MIRIEPFSLASLQKAAPYIQSSDLPCSDLSLGFLYMWRGDDIFLCFWRDTFSVMYPIGEQKAFTWPVGADPEGMIDELKRYALSEDLPLRFYPVDGNTLERIRLDGRLLPLGSAFDRRWSDYLYSFEDAMTFRGKKFNGQRNHVNRFKKLYGEPSVRFLRPGDMPAVREMLSEYESDHPEKGSMESYELKRTKSLLDVYGLLGLYAACLTVGGKIAAVSVGEVRGEMLIIHVEKALRKYEGIYPAMYSGFVSLIARHLGRRLKLVNREDDSGDPGLRVSKLQYHPLFMADKYLVHASSPAAALDNIPVLSSGDVCLTGFRETDKKNYYLLSIDEKNNLLWGYDYKKDYALPDPPDEDSFYESVLYDMRAGDSVNFAVRLSPEGEMIGEGIVWNFTSGGHAEIGCRLFPSYQGRGYGKTAFGLLANFAEKTLKTKVRAKCDPRNAASIGMIEANGFTRVADKDGLFCFERGE